MTGSPDTPLSLMDFLKAEEGPTIALPAIPAPSPRVKKLQARVEKLQLSPSTIAQIKDRTPGTPSSLNRPVTIQQLGDREQFVTSPTPTNRFNDRDPETPSSFLEFLRAEEQEDNEAPDSGFSLQEFLQEDKQKENDELIDKLLAKVSEPIPETPSRSPPKKPSKSKRPHMGKLGRRLKALGHSKESKTVQSEPRGQIKAKTTRSRTSTESSLPNKDHEEPTAVTRVTSDIHLTMHDLFNDDEEQPRTVGGLESSPADNGISIFEFLEQEEQGRPDSPILPPEFGLTIVNKDPGNGKDTKLGPQAGDDVFKIRSSFSSMREQKKKSLSYRPPALVPQKYPIDILPELPARLLNRDDFMTSAMAAMRSISAAASPAHPKSVITVSSPRPRNGTPLSLQRAVSTAARITTSRATSRLSDTSSSAVVQVKRHSLASFSDIKRHSLTSIVEMKRHSLTSITEASKRLSIPNIVELKRHSIDSIAEVSKRLALPNTTDKRVSAATDSTTSSGSPSMTHGLKLKKLRSLKDLSLPAALRSPRIFSPRGGTLAPRKFEVPKFDDVSEEVKQAVRKKCSEATKNVKAEWTLWNNENNDFHMVTTFEKGQKRTNKTEEEKQRDQEEFSAAYPSWGQNWAQVAHDMPVEDENFKKSFHFKHRPTDLKLPQTSKNGVPEYVVKGTNGEMWSTSDLSRPVFWHGPPFNGANGEIWPAHNLSRPNFWHGPPFPALFDGLSLPSAQADLEKIYPSKLGLAVCAVVNKTTPRTSGLVDEQCPLTTEADFDKITPWIAGLKDEICPLPVEADFNKNAYRTSSPDDELCQLATKPNLNQSVPRASEPETLISPLPIQESVNNMIPCKSALADELCPLPTEADFNKSTLRASRPETPMSPPFISRATSRLASRPETPISPSFVSRTASLTTSLTAAPLLTPLKSIKIPSAEPSFTCVSRISSRRQSATDPVSAANPFGPMISWDRPEGPSEAEVVPVVARDGENDDEAEGEQDGFKYPTDLIRYYTHDEVQKALRKIYASRVSEEVTATQAAQYFLDTLNRKYTSEVKLDYFEGKNFSEPSMGREFWRSLWALKFLERCEKNGW
jgi:hypothetical protein